MYMCKQIFSIVRRLSTYTLSLSLSRCIVSLARSGSMFVESTKFVSEICHENVIWCKRPLLFLHISLASKIPPFLLVLRPVCCNMLRNTPTPPHTHTRTRSRLINISYMSYCKIHPKTNPWDPIYHRKIIIHM